MKEIHLTQGKTAIVDDADYEMLAGFKWYANKLGRTFYAMRNVRRGGRKTAILMHREIMQAEPGAQVDHENGDGLNNQRSNLRIASHRQNHCNLQKIKRKCSSDFKGVHWDAATGKWRSRISPGGKSIHLGLFASEIEAAKTYDNAAKQRYGEFARINFG